MYLETIQGCRPTSVTTHPASIVMTASTPEAAVIHRKGLFSGIRRRKTQVSQYQADSRNSSVPIPTMTSHARCTVLVCWIVGSWSAGTEFSPWTMVDLPVAGSDNQDARPGMGMPPLTVPLSFRCPRIVSGTSLLVVGTSSIAANLTGWSLYTH